MSEINEINARIAAEVARHKATVKPLYRRRTELCVAAYMRDADGNLPIQKNLAAKLGVSITVLRRAVENSRPLWGAQHEEQLQREIGEVGRLRDAGLTFPAIARQLGIPQSRAYSRWQSCWSERWDARREPIIQRFRQGATKQDVANEFPEASDTELEMHRLDVFDRC